MSAAPKESPKKPRPWWRRKRFLLPGLALLTLAGLALFHQFLFHWAIPRIAPRLTAHYGFPLQLSTSGSIWRDLTIHHLETQNNPPPWLQTLKLDSLELVYSPRDWFQNRRLNALQSVKLTNLKLEADLRQLPTGKERSPSTNPTTLPSLQLENLPLPETAQLTRINLHLTLADGSILQLKNLNLDWTRPQKPPVQIAIQIRAEQASFTKPDGQTLSFPNLHTSLHLDNHQLTLKDLALPFAAKLQQLQLDLSQLSEGQLTADLQLSHADASLVIHTQLRALPTDSPVHTTQLQLRNASPKNLFSLPIDLPQEFDFTALDLDLQVSGPLKKPQDCDANLELRIQQPRYNDIKLPALHLQASLDQQNATLIVPAVNLGADNRLTLQTQLRLSDNPRIQTDLQLHISDPAALLQTTGLPIHPLTPEAELHLRASLNGSLQDLLQQNLQAIQLTLNSTGREIRIPFPETESPLPALSQITHSAIRRASTLPPLLPPPLMNSHANAKLFQKTNPTSSPQQPTLNLQSWELDLKLEQALISLTQAKIHINPKNHILASGSFSILTPHAFALDLQTSLPDLPGFTPLLQALNISQCLEGRLHGSILAEGELKPWTCNGHIDLHLEALKSDHLPQAIGIQTRIHFQDQTADILASELRFGPWSGLLQGHLTPDTLTLSHLTLSLQHLPILEAALSLPLAVLKGSPSHHLRHSTALLHFSAAINQLGLSQIYPHFNLEHLPPATLSLQCHVHGPVNQLEARLSASLTEVVLSTLPSFFEPPTAQFQFQFTSAETQSELVLHLPPLQPLTLTATTPLDLPGLLENPQSIRNLPIHASASLPESDLAFLQPGLASQISALPARASLTAQGSGSIHQPQLQGDFILSAPEIKLQGAEMPSIRDLIIHLQASNQTIELHQVGLMLAGGQINATGSVDLSQLTDPTLDLHLIANEALVYRSPEVSLRANADLHCRGPLSQAHVSGLIQAVRGRLFKNIDLSPALKLPSNTARPPPATARKDQELLLPDWLHPWTFDVKIQTRDPFIASGNLFSGAATADLSVGGTGAEPQLSGSVDVERLLLRLPFSTIKLLHGRILLDPADPLDPQLDFRAESINAEHQIQIYVNNRLSDPKTRFSSSPPLSEPDIASLLATGSTLSGDGTQFAGEMIVRTLYLYISERYRKWFKKTKKINEEPPRLHVGFAPAGVGADRASDAMQATYDLTRNWRLQGQFAPSGRVRTAIGYLIRFGRARSSQSPETNKEVQP